MDQMSQLIEARRILAERAAAATRFDPDLVKTRRRLVDAIHKADGLTTLMAALAVGVEIVLEGGERR